MVRGFTQERGRELQGNEPVLAADGHENSASESSWMKLERSLHLQNGAKEVLDCRECQHACTCRAGQTGATPGSTG
jgi:hypothetical protein